MLSAQFSVLSRNDAPDVETRHQPWLRGPVAVRCSGAIAASLTGIQTVRLAEPAARRRCNGLRRERRSHTG